MLYEFFSTAVSRASNHKNSRQHAGALRCSWHDVATLRALGRSLASSQGIPRHAC